VKRPRIEHHLPDDPLWYKDAIFYEVRVRSFYDSNDDGVGDLAGLTQKLDYIQDLGVNTIWLLPFYPSPQRDDGYDIANYVDVHPDCGTLRDFKIFLREAHRRRLRVVTELVINHTSSEHPWFQRARHAPPDSSYRKFYVWSDTPQRYQDARIIFPDFEHSNWAWDPIAKAYYWHRFYSHQPDLNFDHPATRQAVMRVLDFWLGMGVDGMRLDAVPYLYEREGTNCENLPETHAFLKKLRERVDRKFPNRMLLAEANQWPEDAVAYFDKGDECHMAFHFPLMPRLFMAIRMEDRFPIVDTWGQTPQIPPNCQWAVFLRNHDELTLEMVTEEEREFMYRAYAQEARMRVNLGIRRRLAPLLGNNRRAMELINGLLLSLPGTPVIYYGDEIGMGDNVYLGDRDGVRTPMQWSADLNAGFSRANPQRLILPVIIDHEYHYQTINVDAQQRNPHSLLWWMKRLIALRKRFKAFGRGSIEFLQPENSRVIAFIRSYEQEQILVVANLSRFVQFVQLDLARFKGLVPIELFSRAAFPAIGEQNYFMTLGPHGFVWFSLEKPRVGAIDAKLAEAETPRIEVETTWEGLMRGEAREILEPMLRDYIPRCRWFRAKTRIIRSARIVDAIPVCNEGRRVDLALVNLEYNSGDPEIYLLPLGQALGDQIKEVRTNRPQRALAELKFNRRGGLTSDALLYDALEDEGFCTALLDVVDRRRRLHGARGELVGSHTTSYRQLRERDEAKALKARVLRGEQTNSSIVYGDKLMLKLFRLVERGVSPDLELSRCLSERLSFKHTPPLAGYIEYHVERDEPRTVAIVHGFVPNQGDAWEFTAKEVALFFERAATKKNGRPRNPSAPLAVLAAEGAPDAEVSEMIGAYLDAAHLLGQRTAELHLALSSVADDPAFAPEPFSKLFQRSTYQSMRNLANSTFRAIRAGLPAMGEDMRKMAQELLARQAEINSRFENFLNCKITVKLIRCHGDLHLGQILNTGKDFVFIDFEGEPARSLNERRHKRSALRDVAGMLRSFHYAAFNGLLELRQRGAVGGNDFTNMAPWAQAWQIWCSWAFLKSYLKTAAGAPFVPRDSKELHVLLEALILEKAIYEAGYELNNRPDWLTLSLQGITQILDTIPAEKGRQLK
jgi:maltose alpha-D-glucosyltransferase/alpha-amylase